MPKALLVAVVEDDQFFRESMRRLLRSLGYAAEAFPSAADFLASPRLGETACLIADLHMPAMTGLELHRRVIDMGHAIPTILVTAYPDNDVRARAQNDGVVCYLRKPVDEEHLMRCLRAALRSDDRPKRIHELLSEVGKVNRNAAPLGSFASAHSRPPWASMIDRQIDSPIPTPLDFVV